jgi:hypothetical protein
LSTTKWYGFAEDIFRGRKTDGFWVRHEEDDETCFSDDKSNIQREDESSKGCKKLDISNEDKNADE